MTSPIIIAALAASLAQGSLAAPAGDRDQVSDGMDKREFTCPVGGEHFTQEVGYSTFPLVTFPDGSYPGDEGTDAEIPVCPGNGLVLIPDFDAMNQPGSDRVRYSDYSSAELAQLPALIADPAYSALKPDGRHIQALWLATRLGRPPFTGFSLLQRGTWAAVEPALRRRLVERLVAEGPALIDSPGFPAEIRRHARYFIVNALRELGRFDEALALIDRIESEGPPVAAPADPDNMYGPGAYAPQMRAVIAARDDDRYPVGLMPDKWAATICTDEERRPPYGSKTAATKAACARRSEAKRRQEAEFQAASKEADRLQSDPAALSRSCAATPVERRSQALALACLTDEEAGDMAAGKALAKDGPRLAAQCEATPRAERSGALLDGCLLYRSALESALVQAVATDDPAFALLCPGEGLEIPEDRAPIFYQVCARAVQWRERAASERLQADPAALDARCAAVPERERDGTLGDACMWRGFAIEEAELKRIGDDPKLFEARCGRFRKELANGDALGLDDSSDELRYCRRIKSLHDDTGPSTVSDAELDLDGKSSVSVEARARAAAIIAKAKAEGAYPKRQPGDTDE